MKHISKFIILGAALGLLSTSVLAKEGSVAVGPQLGINISNINYTAVPGTTAPSISSKLTFDVGGQVEYGLNDMWFIETGLVYVQRGAKVSSPFLGDIDSLINYLRIPVLAKAKFGGGKDIRWLGLAGLGVDLKMSTTNMVSPASTDIPLIIGAGAEWNMLENTWFGQIRYNMGLTDQSTGDDKWINTAVSFVVGVNFSL